MGGTDSFRLREGPGAHRPIGELVEAAAEVPVEIGVDGRWWLSTLMATDESPSPVRTQRTGSFRTSIRSACGFHPGWLNRIVNSLQGQIADRISEAGLFPLSPSHPDAQFDVGWQDDAGRLHIVEVKTLTADNEDRQLRLGLGQILDYAKVIGEVAAALAVSAEPSRADHWRSLGDDHGVLLVWPGRLHLLLES